MSNTNSQKIILWLFLLTSLISCNSLQEEVNPEEQLESHVFQNLDLDEVRVNAKYQFLEFGDNRLLQEKLDFLYENQDQRDAFELSYDGFISQKMAYNEIDSEEEYKLIAKNLKDHPFKRFLRISTDKINGEMEADRVVRSPVLAHVVSKDGLLRVGDKLQKFVDKKILTVVNPTDAQILEMMDWEGNTTPEYGEVWVSKVKDRKLTTTKVLDECTSSYWAGRRGNTLFRVVGDQDEITSTPGNSFVREWSFRTRGQRRFSGIWWSNNNADLTATLNGDFRLGNTGPFTEVDMEVSENNVRIAEDTRRICLNNNGTNEPCETMNTQWENGATGGHDADQDGPGSFCNTFVP